MTVAVSQLETQSLLFRVIDSNSQRDKASLASCRAEFQTKCKTHFELPMSFEFKKDEAPEIPQAFMGRRQDAIGVECVLVALPTDRVSADFVMRKLHFIAGQHGLLQVCSSFGNSEFFKPTGFECPKYEKERLQT
jgi:hypothetical protein